MRTILRSRWRLGAALAGVFSLLALTACSSAPNAATDSRGRVRIVAAENFWGSIATQLAGSGAVVTSIVSNPDADPHDYEPTARDARAIASASYVIENGIGYDAWVQKLLDANPASGRIVLNAGKAVGVADGGNPHQWYSPRSVQRFIARVTADLEKLDPHNRAAYERRKDAYESSALREYDGLVSQIEQRFRGTPIGASESVVTPLARALGLELITPDSFLDAIAEGNEPTVTDKATVDAQIADHRIEVFVYNRQNSTPDVQRLVDAARHQHIPVTTVTETLAPGNVTFQAWQVRELRALLGALSTASSR